MQMAGEGKQCRCSTKYSTRHPERVEAFAEAVARIPDLTARVEQERAREWRGWPSLNLERAAALNGVFDPIAVATR